MSGGTLRITGLFAGIGGFERGLQLAGHEAELLCEVDDAASAVLENRFPGVAIHRDVRKLGRLPAATDLLVAGFPCQDLSQAGQTKGISGKNSGLVREVFRLLERKRVPHVLIENVPNMLALRGGGAMTRVISGLESLGYRWAYRTVDTRAFGLPQRRHRVYILASRVLDPAPVLLSDQAEQAWPRDDFELDAGAYGFYWTEGNKGIGWAKEAVPPLKGGSGVGIPSPPAIWLRRRKSNLPSFVTPTIELAETLHGFPRGWTATGIDSFERRRWRLVGNAVSVPVAEWIGSNLIRSEFGPVHGTPLTRQAAWPRSGYGQSGSRFSVELSLAPLARKPQMLSAILSGPRDATALSQRAALGFLKRLKNSRLHTPEPFREALSEYVELAAE
jgi:DNA (cytosine-5)-methyltransferase 1